MITNLKALLVVLAIASVVFGITKAICLKFMSEDNWTRRRNVWFAITIAAFISPSFWLFAAIAFFITYWAAKRDSNPLALWMLIATAVPPDKYELPRVLDIGLIAVNHSRVLALSIVLPLAWHLYHLDSKQKSSALKKLDLCVIGYIFFQLAIYFPFTSTTNILRSLIENILDAILIYYVFSRTAQNRGKLVEFLTCFVLACAIFGPIGMFESLKTWLLYETIPQNWGASETFAYLMRGDSLRARASTGHALALGALSAMAFGFWLYLSSRFQDRKIIAIGAIWFWIGLIAAYSRGPWMLAVLILFVYLWFNTNRTKIIVQVSGLIVLLFLIALLTPFGSKIIDNLPFVGTVDNSNIIYRQRLIEKSWEIIQENPFFGDPMFLTKMEELRQGQGIIDLVNGYLYVALQTGIVGLTLFFGPILYYLIKVYRNATVRNADDPDLRNLASILFACFVGQLFSIGTSGMNSTIYIWIGILAGGSVVTSKLFHRLRTS